MAQGLGLASELPLDRRAPRSPDDPDAAPKPRAGSGALSSGGGETLTEYMEIEGPDGPVVEETPDGGLLVTIGEAAEERPEPEGFYGNLALSLPDGELNRISAMLMRLIDQDKEARKERDKQYEEGIRRTGMGKDAPGGAQFEGASKVVHPMMTEATIDFESRIMKELWPPAGPVKQKMVGAPTKEKAERAKRVTEFMNWQLTTKIKEAYTTFETTFTQVPLGGSQFVLLRQDHRLKRPTVEFVPVDKIALPMTAANFYSAHRRTFMDTVASIEFKQRVEQGLYRDLKLGEVSMQPDPTKAEKASHKVEGVEDTGMNVDGDRETYMTMSYLEVTREMADAMGHEEEGELNPYLIYMDVSSKSVLGFYRDWEEEDAAKEPIDHIFEFPFIPWRGAYAIGLPHIIGGLSAAATGALRALLDSAHISNVPGGLIRKGSGVGGQSRKPMPTEFQEIEGNLETDDIRKLVMPYTFNQPSPVLFQLMGFLVEAAKGTVRTSLDETPAQSNTNVPVGTQLSRVEEGLVVFSQIHGRTHQAFNRFLAGLWALNRQYLPEVLRVDDDGKEIMVRRKDFEGAPSVRPVSDPTIYSDQQRAMQVTGMEQSALQFPQLYNARAIQKFKLELWKVPDPESFLNPAPEPHELNAVNENLAMSTGKPAVAFPEQDHLAHLQVHLDFMQSPMLGANPLIGPAFLPAALKHCAEHIVYHYVRGAHDIVTEAAGVDASELMSSDDKVKMAFDRLLAMASQKLVPTMARDFANAIPVLQQAMQLVKSWQPPPPMDPAAAAVQAAAAETQRKGANDKAVGALGQAKLQADAANNQARNATDQQRNAIDWARVGVDRDNAALEAQTKLETTSRDNDTALEIAEQRVAMGRDPGFSTGESMRGS